MPQQCLNVVCFVTACPEMGCVVDALGRQMLQSVNIATQVFKTGRYYATLFLGPRDAPIFLGQYDAQGLDLAEECTLMHAEFARCREAVEVVAAERFPDGLCFNGADRRLHVAVNSDRGHTRQKLLRQVLWFYRAFPAQHKSVFNDVLQFPHIARVIVCHQERHDFMTDSGN